MRDRVGTGGQGPVRIRLLGGFEVAVGDQRIDPSAWPTRRATELVQLLALAEGGVLARDQVIEALWPHLDAEAGAANLRKAAHHARRTLGSDDAVVLRRGEVALFPDRAVLTDVREFMEAADDALATDDPSSWSHPAARYRGDLLPQAIYEDWTQRPRRHVRARYLDLLRHGRQWETLAECDPTDEWAHRQLMRAALRSGNRHAAVQWYGRLRTALLRDLGVLPSPETDSLYDECVAGLGVQEPVLVGRQVELARAAAALRSPNETPMTALIVRGPAGIGKSFLCDHVAESAARAGWRSARAAATFDPTPYGPVAEMIAGLLTSDRSLLDRVGRTTRFVLHEVLASGEPDDPPERSVNRHQVIGAIRRLAEAAGAPGVLLVLDDAHAADEATIDLLMRLAAPGGARILVVLAYRGEPASASLVRGAARLVRAGRATELDLRPLDADESRALVHAVAGPTLEPKSFDEVVALADGNPFFLVELARQARAGRPPASATDAVLARFVDLDEARVAMLARLAVATVDLDPTDVAALTGASEDDAFALLDGALAAGVLVVSGTRYRFRHDLVRAALVEQLTPHQRIAVHRDAARRLAAADAPPALVARHWLDGGRPEAACEWMVAAARRAMRLGAFADAVKHLAVVLEHRPDDPEALCIQADALDALGTGGAPAAYAAAAAANRASADELRAKQALAQLKLGDIEGALTTVSDVDPRTLEGRLARALTLSAAAALGFTDPGAARRHAAESRRLALELGDPTAAVAASWAQALAAHACGQLHDSLRADLRDTASLPELAIAVFDGQLCVTQRMLYGAAPYPEVIAFADSLGAEAHRLGAIRGEAFALTLRGEAELLSGRLEASDRDLADAARLHRSIAAPTGEAHDLQRRAEVALHEGRRADSESLLRDALAIARESSVGFHLMDRIYGTWVSLAADRSAAVAVLDEAEESISGPIETCPGCRITFEVPAAIAAARAGEPERAERHAEAAATLARVVMQLPAWHAAVDEVRGHLARAHHDRVGAEERFGAAARSFAAAGHPLDAVRCQTLCDGTPSC